MLYIFGIRAFRKSYHVHQEFGPMVNLVTVARGQQHIRTCVGNYSGCLRGP